MLHSVETPEFDVQTQRQDSLYTSTTVITVSMDLPLALDHWTSSAGVTHPAVSSHRSEDFGRDYGVLIKEWRAFQRSIFVIDPQGRLTYAEYVPDQNDEPDYDAAVAAVSRLAG